MHVRTGYYFFFTTHTPRDISIRPSFPFYIVPLNYNLHTFLSLPFPYQPTIKQTRKNKKSPCKNSGRPFEKRSTTALNKEFVSHFVFLPSSLTDINVQQLFYYYYYHLVCCHFFCSNLYLFLFFFSNFYLLHMYWVTKVFRSSVQTNRQTDR